MSKKNPKNISMSIQARLLNRAKVDHRPFAELLQYYGMERFLYRLSESRHSDRFILKGALMFKVWKSSLQRPTMDIDMLGVTSNEEEKIVAQIQDILSVNVISDGLTFDPGSIKTAKILEEVDYQGIKVMFQGKLDSAKIYMQIDIGFGDIVFPQPKKAILPTLLNFPAPILLCYSMESAIAEKFDAMVARGMTNSRMKDFYDVWLLSRQFSFEEHKLAEAVRLTFGQRQTEIPNKILAFSQEFIKAKQTQWEIFRNKLQQEHVPELFQEIIVSIESFLRPTVFGISSGATEFRKWNAPGPWV